MVVFNSSNTTIIRNFSFKLCDETHIYGNISLEESEDILEEIKHEEDYSCALVFHKWFPVMLICLIVLGVLFNGFILVTFIQLPRIRNFTNHFVANLALADILMVVINPILFLLLLYQKIEYETGDTLRFNFEIFCAMASLTSFASISVDRMLAISKPIYHHALPRSRCRKVIVFIWIFSLTTTLLDYFLSAVVDNFLITCCNFCVGYVIPTIMTVFSYIIIAKVVVRRRRDFQATGHDMNDQMKHTIRITWKILLVILPGIVMWSMFWAPLFIFVKNEEEKIFSLSFLEIRSLIPIFTATVNPLIFILMTPELRRYWLNTICHRHRTVSGETNTVRSAQITRTMPA